MPGAAAFQKGELLSIMVAPHMRGHAVQLLLCPELSRGQWMLGCLSGGCSSQVPALASPPVCHWCQCQLCFLTLYTVQNLQSKEKKVPSFHRVYLICFSPLLSHSQPVSLAALLFQGWPGQLRSPSISSPPWLGLSYSAHPQAPSWKLSSNSDPPLLQRAHPS